MIDPENVCHPCFQSYLNPMKPIFIWLWVFWSDNKPEGIFFEFLLVYCDISHNPSHPYISMHILNNSLYTFPFLLMRRICLGLIQGWLRRENVLIILCLTYNNTTLKIIFSSHLVSYKFTFLMWSHNWDVFFIKFMCRRNTSKLGVLVLEWIKSSHLRQTPSCLKMIRR